MYQKLLKGRGSLARIKTLTDKLNLHKPLIVAVEPVLSGLLNKASELNGMPVFSDFHPNPDLADCARGAEVWREHACDGLIAIGGGSTLDTAKGIKAILCAGNAENAKQGLLDETMTIPVIAVPATAGTGAEATPFAALYEDGTKLSLAHPMLRPDGVVLDSELLDTLPEYHKKSCALDALAQGIESWWANGATEDSRVHAYLAILGVLDNLRGYLAGDPHAADEMLEAAYQSGQAIAVSKTTAAHAMSYRLTTLLGKAHGHACMLTLPVLWEDMLADEEMLPVLKELASVMRLGDPLMGPRLLRGILYDLGMEAEEMPGESVLDELAASVNAERMSNHPVTLTAAQLKTVYRRAFIRPTVAERQACLDIWEYYAR